MNDKPKVFGENDVTIIINGSNIVFYYGSYEFKYVNDIIFDSNENLIRLSFKTSNMEQERLEIETEKRLLSRVGYVIA